jgi:type IV pilus assembly protein PilN
MYSLDINFLRDRGLDAESKAGTQTEKPQLQVGANIPIIAGLIAAISLPAASFGFVKVIESQKADLEQQIQAIDAQIASASSKNKEVQAVKDQLGAIDGEISALVTVFNQIKPWSAVLQDIGDRTPPGVQVTSIQQSLSAAAPATPAAATPTESKPTITLDGMARSFDDVNDLMIFLQKSKFFNAEKVQLTKAELAEYEIVWDKDVKNKDKASKQANQPNNPKDKIDIEVPKGVKYNITAELSSTPASQLITELNSKGAIGLVSRIQTLERKGAITK